MEAKESGWSVDDMIEYVRKIMYHELVNLKNKDDESDIDSESNNVIENITGDLADASDGDNEKNNEKENISNKSPEKNANGNDDEDDNYFKPELLSSDSENEDVPHDYVFLSFVVFILWGPFVEPDSCLISISSMIKIKIRVLERE